MFEWFKRKSSYTGNLKIEGKGKSKRKGTKKNLRFIIYNIIRREKMSRREWIVAKGVSISEKDASEEVVREASSIYSEMIVPFLKIVYDEPLKRLGIEEGDVVGIKTENQSTSGTMCSDHIIEPKKSLTLPKGKFDLEITKLREKPSGIISEVRAYLGEL